MITKLAALAVLLLVLAPVASAARPHTSSTSTAKAARANHLRQTARTWEAVIGLPVAQTRRPAALRFWRKRLRAVLRVAQAPPHKSGWLCIHRFEGSWSDSGDPYWGGLQMDQGFMKTYAPKALLRRGWANRWTPLEQMWVAERAHRSGRGYGPWPNTARYCGLL